jgi:hypothetical protein
MTTKIAIANDARGSSLRAGDQRPSVFTSVSLWCGT